MSGLGRRRIRAIVRKELRAYRRNGSIVAGMAIIPLVFLVQPLVSVFAVNTLAAHQLRQHHELLYLLAIPALVPVMLAAYAIVGERQEGTLEPLLTTPLRRDELLLGKALAVIVPSVGIAYAVFGVFLVLVALFAQPGVASALIRGPDVLAQVVFTPLIAGWSIWLGMAISTRVSDVRVAQQISRARQPAHDRGDDDDLGGRHSRDGGTRRRLGGDPRRGQSSWLASRLAPV